MWSYIVILAVIVFWIINNNIDKLINKKTKKKYKEAMFINADTFSEFEI